MKYNSKSQYKSEGGDPKKDHLGTHLSFRLWICNALKTFGKSILGWEFEERKKRRTTLSCGQLAFFLRENEPAAPTRDTAADKTKA